MPEVFVRMWVASTIVTVLAGCRLTREYPPVPYEVNAAVLSSRTASASPHLQQVAATSAERTQTRKNYLVLSGGGMQGAFTAGVLCGWTKTGNRPEFDVVTGVSTGALIAPLAFLGQEFDPYLEQLYTSEGATKIYKIRFFGMLTDAIASSDPLHQQIQRMVTDDFVARIAAEHQLGRRLYVSTTNLDTQRQVIWDVGAIAAGTEPNKRDLICKVLLASCSIPGLLPPVPINVTISGKRYTELHVDGGVCASMFLLPQSVELTSADAIGKQPSSAAIYAILAGKAIPDSTPVNRGLLQVSDASLQGMLRSQQEHDLVRTYLLAYFSNASFQMIAIPQEFAVLPRSMDFNMQTMRSLFNEGHRLGELSTSWSASPPAIDPTQWAIPRAGTELIPVNNATAKSGELQ
jgi:predicted acylesterase/phospholipase RssA